MSKLVKITIGQDEYTIDQPTLPTPEELVENSDKYEDAKMDTYTEWQQSQDSFII